jgi:hypothetical protein
MVLNINVIVVNCVDVNMSIIVHLLGLSVLDFS